MSCLVLLQERRVVCVVEGQRQDAACSVARLISRLQACEILVYTCPSAEATQLRDDHVMPTIPENWRELYRAPPLADDVVAVH